MGSPGSTVYITLLTLSLLRLAYPTDGAFLFLFLFACVRVHATATTNGSSAADAVAVAANGTTPRLAMR